MTKCLQTVKTSGEYTFTCHHGEKECVGNKVIACVLKDKSVPLSDHFKFINCTSFNIAANVKVEEYPVKMVRLLKIYFLLAKLLLITVTQAVTHNVHSP